MKLKHMILINKNNIDNLITLVKLTYKKGYISEHTAKHFIAQLKNKDTGAYDLMTQ